MWCRPGCLGMSRAVFGTSLGSPLGVPVLASLLYVALDFLETFFCSPGNLKSYSLNNIGNY